LEKVRKPKRLHVIKRKSKETSDEINELGNEVKSLKDKMSHGFLQRFEGATSVSLNEETDEEDKPGESCYAATKNVFKFAYNDKKWKFGKHWVF